MVYESEINIFNDNALQNKFSTIQTQFDVTLGKISAILSDSEIEEYLDGHTSMNTRLSSTIQDLNGVHTQVSSMQTEYRDGFTDVASKLTQFSATLDGIYASVSNSSGGAVATDTVYYLATSQANGVTTSTTGWTTAQQYVSDVKPYLWVYHAYTYSSGGSYNSIPVVIDIYESGSGYVSTVRPLYYCSSSKNAPALPTSNVTSTATTTGVWTRSIPTADASHRYIWTCEQLEYSDGSYDWTGATCLNYLAPLVDRVSAAELKITDNAIISTVTETTAGQTALSSVIEQNASTIRLKAQNIVWESDHSSMTADGILTCYNANIYGQVNIGGATESGVFGLLTMSNTNRDYVGIIDKNSFAIRRLTNHSSTIISNYGNHGVYIAFDIPFQYTSPSYWYQTASFVNWNASDGSSSVVNLCDGMRVDAFNATSYDRSVNPRPDPTKQTMFVGFNHYDNPLIYLSGVSSSDDSVTKRIEGTDFQFLGVMHKGGEGHHHKVRLGASFTYSIRSSTESGLTHGREMSVWIGRKSGYPRLAINDYYGNSTYSSYTLLDFYYGHEPSYASSSSKHYKNSIKPISEQFNPHKLLKLQAKEFVYNDDHPLQYEDMRGKTLPGFIAEDVAEIYPSAVIHRDGKVESWDERRIIPGMLALIQELYQEVEKLKSNK